MLALAIEWSPPTVSTNGGFCGAYSLQQAALNFGAWVSQDLVRKANRKQPGPYTMHGDGVEGYEVVPSNVAFTAAGLGLAFDEWDYNSTAPQADAFKSFIKSHLVQGHPVVWLPMCKGDPHVGYPGTSPGPGRARPRGRAGH